MGGVRVRVVPVRGDAPRGRVVRLPAGSRRLPTRRVVRCVRFAPARVAVAPARWCCACRKGGGGRSGGGALPAGTGGFRTGGSCSCRCGWRPYRRCAVHAGTGGPVPTGGADLVGAGGPAPSGAGRCGRGARAGWCRGAGCRYDWPSSGTGAGGETAPARWCRARRKRVASAPAGRLVPVWLAAVPALCRARRYGRTRTDGWCRSGRRGRTRAGWCLARRKRAASAPAGRARAGAAGGRTGAVPCTPVRADPYRRVVPIWSARADPRRVVPAGAGGAPAPGGVGVPDAAGPPGEGQAGENKWSLMRRAAPMTPAVGPSSPRTMGRLPVARGSEPR